MSESFCNNWGSPPKITMFGLGRALVALTRSSILPQVLLKSMGSEEKNIYVHFLKKTLSYDSVKLRFNILWPVVVEKS